MTPYALLLTVLALVALWSALSLVRMRREAYKSILAIRAHETAARDYENQAAWIYERAREAYADANARWISVVRIEGSIH